jgi:UDP-GlcNAc:undecaprenyl-phosphate/decaprenyl-phosphate GlcNAc-1-phosphate transferase
MGLPMNGFTSLAFAFVVGGAATLLLARAAEALRLVDHPGGRKEHARPVPLVGGLAIFIAFLAATCVGGVAASAAYFVFALSIVIAVGVWDDVAEISPRVKFPIQIVASSLMIWGAGVELNSVGDLLGWRPIGLWIFAVPLTIFAIVGVINSVNMMDGLDGLGGSIALVAFAWYAAVAFDSGLEVPFRIAIIFCGAIAGFLVFNLRFPWQPHARVFLGDAGSLMIGFALGWFAIDLTQGEGRTFPPIAALWVLLLPLADCVSLMTRRLMRRRSPFVADRHHIHHYLLARGFTHGQTLGALVALSALFGAVGYFGWHLGVSEATLFWPFFFAYFAYHYWIKRAWKALDEKNRAIGIASTLGTEEGEKALPAA